MKSLKIIAAIALTAAVTPSFAALTCGSPTVLTNAGVTGIDGCGPTNAVPTVCLFNSNPSPDSVFSFHLGTGFTASAINLTNHGGASFTPQLIIQSSCGSTTDCTDTATGATAGANLSIPFSAANPTLAAGNTYFLIVNGASQSSATDCGSFDLGVTGSLPVRLEKFSAE